jgi:hypothetical protein
LKPVIRRFDPPSTKSFASTGCAPGAALSVIGADAVPLAVQWYELVSPDPYVPEATYTTAPGDLATLSACSIVWNGAVALPEFESEPVDPFT